MYRFKFSFVSFCKLPQALTTIQLEVNYARLNSDIRTSEATLHTDVQRELWNVRKVVRPSIKNFFIGNLSSLVCDFSLKSFLRSLDEGAILICFLATAFSHKSNCSGFFFFSFPAFTSLSAFLTNNFLTLFQ